MSHGFVAYIDESGDEGFQFQDRPGRGSSRWFVLSALFIPRQIEIEQLRFIDSAIKPIEEMRQKAVHFSKLNHEQRVAISDKIGKSQFRAVNICIDKTRLKSDALKGGYTLYFYATRFLIERLSWLARDTFPKPHGQKIKIIFSNRNRMSYSELRDYIDLLKSGAVQGINIHSAAIDTDLITSRAHAELVGLKAADTLASGIRYGLELTQYGFCEDRYARCFAPIIYTRGDKARPYGLKFFPDAPTQSPEEPGHYQWCDELFPK